MAKNNPINDTWKGRPFKYVKQHFGPNRAERRAYKREKRAKYGRTELPNLNTPYRREDDASPLVEDEGT